MKRVVVHVAETKDFSSEVLKGLTDFAEVKTAHVDQSQLKEALNHCDVFWFRLGYRITEKVILENSRCRYIVTPVTGLDHVDLEACTRAGVKVISLRGETDFLKTIRATAEHTLGLTLALMRHLPEALSHVNDGNWNRDLFKGREIYGKNVGILGVGRLGSIMAGYFKALGARVYGYDIDFFDPVICERLTLQQLFSVVDILSIHLSYDQSTRHLVCRKYLKLMKPHSILINTARGGIVESEDLVWALENNIIAGAALDVIEDEFDRGGNVLLKYARNHSKLIISPHIGGNTYESFFRTETFLLEKLKDLIHGRFA